jgi:diphthamide biosynthesis protein 2
MESATSEQGMTAGYVDQLMGGAEPSAAAAPSSACGDFNFEVERIVAHIEEHGASRVALQFPDTLLPEAPRIANEIQTGCKSPDVFPFILGDITYGSFEVDKVAAEHLGADLIVHFGPTSSMPSNNSTKVLYVFGRKAELSAEHLGTSFADAKKMAEDNCKTTVLLYDMQYHHKMEALCAQFSEVLGPTCEVLLGEPDKDFLKGVYAAGKEEGQPDPQPDGSKIVEGAGAAKIDAKRVYIGGQSILLPSSSEEGERQQDEESKPVLDKLQGSSVLFVGAEGPQLTSILMRCPESNVFSYNPLTRICKLHDMNVNRALMRRYVMMLKAREAKVFGILITTTSSCQAKEMLQAIKHKIRSAGRKFYTVMIGKLNPYKLANFAEVDIFVLLSTPEEALVDSKEYHSPIVTPFELSIALDRRYEWDGSYSTDFREVLPTLSVVDKGRHTNDDNSDSEDDKPYFSVLTGKHICKTNLSFEVSRPSGIANSGTGSSDTTDNNQALTVPNQNTELSTSFYSPAGDFLLSRSYQGLVQGLGQDEAHAAIQGETGIAMGYGDDTGMEGHRDGADAKPIPSVSTSTQGCPCSATSRDATMPTSSVGASPNQEFCKNKKTIPTDGCENGGSDYDPQSISTDEDVTVGAGGMSLFGDINTDSDDDE